MQYLGLDPTPVDTRRVRPNVPLDRHNRSSLHLSPVPLETQRTPCPSPPTTCNNWTVYYYTKVPQGSEGVGLEVLTHYRHQPESAGTKKR